MSRTSRNFVVAYIFLVGLPLLGLVGILRSGRHLHAPISVDGSWKIEATSKAPQTNSCAAVSTFVSSPFAISQSGRSLVVTFGNNKAVVPGSLDDKSVKTAVPGESDSSSGGCGTAILTAVVDSNAEPKSMNGQLSFLGCQSCAPVRFTAVRQPKGQSGGGH